MSRELVNSMLNIIDPEPRGQVFYLGTSEMIQVTRYRNPSLASDRDALACAESSPLHSYFGKGWWMMRSRISTGDHDAWPNPWTTPENQEKRV